ncbi:type I polyketide synthase [Actinomadura algeriensis]|uniref:Acyl transferase domain-containing protein/acyl carrier protein n=1 Tax=Actinomadura algeriensis TaxID=1679523 RepID=A0ABR9JTM1_9ACTN|nr:type I polyketide synthase [Actinomadura algeriensis]MBE1533916.1 acyl transferase domain-containing protein/acyl carrier protein [Actinomadura algeriensis]
MGANENENSIAVVGIGARFPGSRGPKEFWRFIRDGRDAIGEVPADRWDVADFYDPAPATAGKVNNRWGGFVDGIDGFDADFFQVSPREAARTDPQQRVLLEVAWEALEDAGPQGAGGEGGGRGGVFVGVHFSDYECMQAADSLDNDLYSFRGTARSVVAGRLSHALDLRGPSMVVDAACSSSLVAVHLACQALRRGEADFALAAGANVLLDPGISVAFSQGGMLAPDGRCKAFDAAADGFVRSDGFGVVVLKPLARALTDGDRVYAVIRGSAVNNDGRSGAAQGAPGRPGQERVLRDAYADAGVAPSRVAYVEAHGTGTPVGDPVELDALAAVLGADRPAGRPLRVGSVKTNIGHAEGAAGIAGLIKTALCLHEGVLPPTLHHTTPTPAFAWDRLPLRVQTELERWPADATALAGVSSFGITGTNAHVVLEGPPPEQAPGVPDGAPGTGLILPLSARSQAALRARAEDFAETLAGTGEDAPDAVDVCRAAAVRRGHEEHRLAVTGTSAEDLRKALAAFAGGAPDDRAVAGRVAPRRGKVAFVFSGQGSEWAGMCADLMDREPVFRTQVERCDLALRPWTRRSVLERLTGPPEGTAGLPIEELQPLLFTVQVALAALWRSWGVEPDTVIGHSMGEAAAAHHAGRLTLDDAARVIGVRSRLMGTTEGRGGMAVVGMPEAEARRLVEPVADRVSVAALNGPATTVVSGDADVIGDIVADLAGREVFCRRIDIGVAAHSPHMEPLRPLLRAELAGIRPLPAPDGPGTGFHSTADPGAAVLDADYWACNLREPVRFWPAVERLLETGHDTFVEISPHPVLLGAIGQGAGGGAGLATLPSLRRDEGGAVPLDSLARLHVTGRRVDWRAVYPGRGTRVDLPLYPWQRVSFPHRAPDGTPGAGAARPGRAGGAGHPLLGVRLPMAAHPGSAFWESWQDDRTPPYLADHRVDDLRVLPAAGYAEMALAAAAESAPPDGADGPGHGWELTDVLFTAALTISERATRVQTSLTGGPDDRGFQIYSDQGDDEWTLHARGRIARAAPDAAADPDRTGPPPGATELRADDFYSRWAARGLGYGPRFRLLERIWRSGSEVWARTAVPESVAEGRDRHVVHPAVLDACFQTVLAALPDGDEAHLPVGLERLRVHAPIGTGCVVHARLAEEGDSADLTVRDTAGRLLLDARGLRLQRMDAPPGDDTARLGARYEIAWTPVAAPDAPDAPEPRRYLLFDEPGSSLHRVLADRGDAVVRVHPGTGDGEPRAGRHEASPRSRAGFDRVLAETGGAAAFDGVVYAWGVPSGSGTAGDGEDAAARERTVCGGALHLVQALAAAGEDPPRLWLLTAGAVATSDAEPADVGQAALWGFGRTVAGEHPELRCTLVDVEPGDPAPFAAELRADDEDQIAWRDGHRYAARLRPAPAARAGAPDGGTSPSGRLPRPERFRLEAPRPGPLDRLRLAPRRPAAPPPGEVEIEVEVAALNFKDVLRAMGVLPATMPVPLPLGIECAGRITAVGGGVSGLAMGQRVLAVTDSGRGCVASHVTADARTVVPLPAGIAARDAVTVPVAFLTAFYALDRLARMRAGDRVLVHAAAGGVGLAAVQLARAAGAVVLATAGSPEKRDHLRTELGIEHVMDSRTTDFAARVRECTGGAGVDIVLNSLAGEAIDAGLSALAPGGRFVELGKRDIEENTRLGLAPFAKGLSFCSLDVEALLLDRPEEVGGVLRTLLERLAAGELEPLPARTFPVAEAADAFRHLARARHIGKVLVSVAPAEGEDAPAADGDAPASVRSDGSYLVTGGLGALGFGAARVLAERGAGHLVLVGRGAPGEAVAARIGELRAAGTEVIVVRADVARPRELTAAVGAALREAPPLRGIVHAAGVLADRTVAQLTWRDFETVAAPKAAGGWNLHRLAAGAPLDFFVVFSSVAGVLGNPGQANYAAANAALDALVHHRRFHGMPATAIDWGPWADIGLAARPDRGGRLDDRGLPSMTPDEGFAAFAAELDRALDGASGQVTISRFDAAAWARGLPAAARGSLLRDLLAEPADGGSAGTSGDGPGFREQVLAAAPEQRPALLAEHVSRQVARITRTDPTLLDTERPVASMGLDSLMAMEMRQALESTTGVAVPTSRLLNGITISEIAEHLEGRLATAPSARPAAPARGPAPASGAVPAPAGDASGRLADAVEELSEDEVDAALATLLADGDAAS